MFKRKSKLKLGAMLFFVGSFAANAQYNVDYKMAEYLDPQTVESTVDIGYGEVITVGTIKVTDGRQPHEDVILTRLDKSGRIIWNMRYGLDEVYERGNGITLSWDKKHVIVAGSFEKIRDIDLYHTRERYAMVLKVRISDGTLIWTTLNGNDTDEQAFLVKRSNGRDLTKSYVVVGTSTGDREESYERMFAFKIGDNGATSWSNRYYVGENFPYRSIRPTSMVSNGDGTFMIAGTRAEINRPTRLFTVGIKSENGEISNLFNYYETNNIYHVERCDIAKDISDRYDRGYALTFTAKDFRGDCFTLDDDLFYDKDKIGVIRMDASRRVLWSKVYYTKKADNQDGLSIFFYKDELQVGVNINEDTRYNTPGILRLKKENGSIVSLNTYHIPSYRGDYGPLGNSMIRLGDNEYAVKSIYKNWGFSMVNPNLLSKAKCDRYRKVHGCKFKVEPRKQGVKPVEYARGLSHRLPYDKVDYGQYPCEGFGIAAPITTDGEENTGDFSSGVTAAVVYPSPVGENQDVVTLQFLAENAYDLGNIKIFNGQGQEMLTKDIAIIDGQNSMEFSAQQFAPGMYMVLIAGNGEILDRVKFIKN